MTLPRPVGTTAAPEEVLGARRRDAPPEGTTREGVRRLWARLPLHLAVIGLALAWSIPTFALLVSSFRTPQEIAATGWWNGLVPPFSFTLDNYETVLGRRGMGSAFLNSVLITAPATLLVILVAALAAYALAWMRFPGRNVLFLVMVGLLVVPLQTTLIPVLQLLSWLTIDQELPVLGGRVFGIGSYPGIWLAHTATDCRSRSSCCATSSARCRAT